MKLSKIALLTTMILGGFFNAGAQTADEIINKYVDAIGGKEEVSQVKTLSIDGDMDIMNNKAPSITYIVNGKGYKNEVDFNGAKIITCYTDKGGWTINPMAGQTVATPVPEDILKSGQLQLDATGPLFDYALKGNKVEFIGKDSGAYKLKVITPKNIEIAFFIDTATYYILKMITKMTVNSQEFEMAAEYSDYRKTDSGMFMPFSAKLNFPGITITTTIKKIEINKDIDEAIFEMPKN